MHTHIIYGVHSGMENQHRIPMDRYHNILATLYILNQKRMIIIIEKNKRRDV